MDPFSQAIIKFLDTSIANAGLSPEQREQAAYIKASFPSHQNSYRLMAQVSALSKGETLIHPCHRLNSLNEDVQLPVRCLGRELLAIMTDYRVTPTVADLEGRPIELVSILDPVIEDALEGVKRFEFHQALVAMEKRANAQLSRWVRQYGYHFIFRAGLQQYYYTNTVAAKFNFWRPDPRGNAIRLNAQKLCYEAMEKNLHLNHVEKRVLIQTTNCAAADAHRFWTWMEKNRNSYYAMKICLSLLNSVERKCPSRISPSDANAIIKENLAPGAILARVTEIVPRSRSVEGKTPNFWATKLAILCSSSMYLNYTVHRRPAFSMATDVTG